MPGDDKTASNGLSQASGSDETVVDSPSARSRPTPPPREVIGRFTIDRELGVGGMGVVLLAHDPTLDRQVAIKLLRDERSATSNARVRLLREAQAMARLRHPNVVTVYEAGVHEGQVYLVMEMLPGGTLRQRLSGEVATRDILRLYIEAGRGLAAAHRAGLVHRDFKPANVLVDEADHAKVTDFGLAVQDDSTEREARPRTSEPDLDALAHPLTRTGDLVGTPRYMAPEQHAGKDTDPRSDQFSFCVALYEVLYRQHPYRDESLEALRKSMRDEEARAPKSTGRVRNAIMRGLSRDPANRFASMDELLAELAPRRSRAGWLAGGAAALLAIGAVAFALSPGHASDPIAQTKRAALACNCELLDVQVPAGARVIGVRVVGAGGLGPLVVAAWQPTGQLALARGSHVIEYLVGDARYDFAVMSRGEARTRTLALPPPEQRTGYVFVPGGEVTLLGDTSLVELRPYLIESTATADLVSYADARKRAFAQHARLPFAAEWEWAARLGVFPRAGWEWTGSAFAPYPLGPIARDDEAAPRDRSEVRGGSGDLAKRLAGLHTGRAGSRLARDVTSSLVLEPVTVQLAEVPVAGDSTSLEVVVPPAERARLDRFLTTWRQLDPQPALIVEGDTCNITGIVYANGASPTHVEVNANNTASRRATVRVHPDVSYTSASKHVTICTNPSIEILDAICFTGDKLHPGSTRLLEAIAASLSASPTWKRVEVQAYADSDSATLAQRRAEIVRARLIALGVASERLVARGYLNDGDIDDPEHGLVAEQRAAQPPAGCPAPRPGERIAFKSLDPADAAE
ncbi:MAG TPA: protein kinase [Kofleriaceae bacterium]|nr:protein kinase [Kofleriaceae bacterium]